MIPRRTVILSVPALALAACADTTYAPAEEVARAIHSTGNPPSITLFTVVRKKDGSGGHSALMIDASQRVIFDPAGTWTHPRVPVRHDVHYGITEQMRKFFIDYHARETWDVVEQRVYVSPAVAEAALRRVESNGAVMKALCGTSIARVLRDLPGFGSIPQTVSPIKIMRAFGELPGVETTVHKDGDPANNTGILIVQREKPPEE